MSGSVQPKERSFVLFQVDGRRVALPSEDVTELAPPVRLHTFPHATPLLEGVIVRRGRIVPVYRVLSKARNSATQHFYLIAQRGAQAPAELAAIPVAGQCELGSGDLQAPDSRPGYVSGILRIGDESIDVLDLNKLFASGMLPADCETVAHS
jgi:chemotaxis signal transduction protein